MSILLSVRDGKRQLGCGEGMESWPSFGPGVRERAR